MKKTAQKEYDNLKKISYDSRLQNGILALLNWDQETYMPPGAAEIRSEQQALMASRIHEEKTGKAFSDALGKLVDLKSGKIKGKGLTERQTKALKEWQKDYVKDTALPRSFVEEFTKLTSQALVAWRDAKQANTFSKFAPYLDKIIKMNRQKAELLGYKEHPYDALLDLYEPDITTKELEIIFSGLRKEIVPLIKKIGEKKQISDRLTQGKVPSELQMAFGNDILKAMGYDFNRGRLDLSTHPFSSSSHPTDCRITTRIHPTSFMSHLFVVLHEAGHALYEMGLPAVEYGTPLGDAISYGIHESQSRLWETRIGQSQAFWRYFLPKLQKAFGTKIKKAPLGEFYRAINKVEPSPIRVEADEVTYTLHIILRFELERDLIAGKLKVKDVPEAWNAKTKELLGFRPKSDREGCLQDIHWSMGAFGYFPSYSLGNLYASHLFSAFEKQHPEWDKRVAKGDLLFIKEWLHHNVHRYGREYSGKELMEKVTKKPFSEKAYVDYIKNKYKEIYKL